MVKNGRDEVKLKGIIRAAPALGAVLRLVARSPQRYLNRDAAPAREVSFFPAGVLC